MEYDPNFIAYIAIREEAEKLAEKDVEDRETAYKQISRSMAFTPDGRDKYLRERKDFHINALVHLYGRR